MLVIVMLVKIDRVVTGWSCCVPASDNDCEDRPCCDRFDLLCACE